MVPPSGKRPRYGTKPFIQQVLGKPEFKDGLRTKELAVQVNQISDKKIPLPTIFQAARSLVKAKTLAAKRDGREFRFTLTGASGSEQGPAISRPARSPEPVISTGAVDRIEAPESLSRSGGLMEAAASASSLPPSTLPHRLDPGQMLVLRHSETEIVTLTNLHGKPVIERHTIG